MDEICDQCQSGPITLDCPCGGARYCDYKCAKLFWIAGHGKVCAAWKTVDGKEQDDGDGLETNFSKLRTVLSKPESMAKKKPEELEKIRTDTRTEFKRMFPIQHYPYKVMGYNRAAQKILILNKNRSVAVASLFSHQRLNRDFRGPWTKMRGGIIKAPTGAGKTATLHSMLANYSRELIPLKTPIRFHLNPQPDVTSKNLSKRDDYVLRTLIYVTKTELVADVRKDFWAQKDRSQALYSQLLKANRIPHDPEHFAPFRQNVNVMSYKQFDNLLRGTNARGRNFWAGLDIGAKASFEQIDLDLSPASIPSKIIVPTAYWKNGKRWQRGARPHFIEDTFAGVLGILIEYQVVKHPVNTLLASILFELEKLTLAEARTYHRFKQNNQTVLEIQREQNVEVRKLKRNLTRHVVSFTMTMTKWTADNRPDPNTWSEFVIAINEKLLDAVRTKTSEVSGGRVMEPEVYSLSPEPLKDDPKVGWKLENVGSEAKPIYQWQRSNEGDYADFNPCDRLVVGFDEAHLIFNPEKLLAQEAADAGLIVKTLKDSNAVAFFASATIDGTDGLQMGNALVSSDKQKSSVVPQFDRTKQDLLEYLNTVDEKQEKIGTQLRGLISVTTVEGMRDLFPDKVYDEPFYVPIGDAHAADIRRSLSLSTTSLMNTINLGTRFEDHYDIATESYDPDKTLRELLPRNGTLLDAPGPIVSSPFPIGRELLKQMREADINEQPLGLTGRGVVTSSQRDDTIRSGAAIMQAVGYQWLYLLPNANQKWEDKQKLRNARQKGESIDDSWRSVKWTDRALNKHATLDTISQLGLEDHVAMSSLIDGEAVAPKFVVLSNALLVKQFGETISLSTREDFASYALTSRDFKIPYKLRSNAHLRALGVSPDTLALLRGSNKPVLHFFPATPEAAEVALERYATRADRYSVFEGATSSFWFVVRKQQNVTEFVRIDLRPKVDSENFTPDALEEVATKSAAVQSRMRDDAKDMILTFFNHSLESMRRQNLRYILLGRAFGQGFDVFHVTKVWNTEPAPDRATEVQRRGRFARPGSHSDLPYDRWLVNYHTFVARFPLTQTPIYSSDLADLLEDAVDTPGAYAVTKAIETSPIDEEVRNDFPMLAGQNVEIHPYQAVRIKIENPTITWKRLQQEQVFDTWAIDSEHNEIIRETEDQKVHAPTNYVLSGQFLTSHYRNILSQLAEQPSLDEAALRSDYDREHMLEYVAILQSNDKEQTEAYNRKKEQEVAEVIAGRQESGVRRDKLESGIVFFNQLATISIDRRLASDERNRTLSVNQDGTRWELSIEDFVTGGEEITPTSFLQYMVRRGWAQFNPEFRDVSPKEKRGKPGEQGQQKKQKQTISGDFPTSGLLSAKVLMERLVGGGSTASNGTPVSEFTSFGTIVEKTAFPDQEQDVIERAVAEQMLSLTDALGYYSDNIESTNNLWPRTRFQKIADAIYTKIGGSITERNPSILKSAVLTLHQYGVMDWNRALVQLAHAFHSLPSEKLPEKSKKQKVEQFFRELAHDIGRLFAMATRQYNDGGAMQSISTLFWDSDPEGRSNARESPAERRMLIEICHHYTASLDREITLKTLGEFFETLTDRYHIQISGKHTAIVLGAFRTYLNDLEPSQDPHLGDMFRSLIAVSSKLDIAGVDRKDHESYVTSLADMMTADKWNVGDFDVNRIYTEHNKELRQLSRIAKVLSNDAYRKDVHGKTVSELLVDIYDESRNELPPWPISRFVSSIQQIMNIDDPNAALNTLVGIVNKLKEYTVENIESAIVKSTTATGLSYETDAGTFKVNRSSTGTYNYRKGDELVRLDVTAHLLLGALRDEKPRLFFTRPQQFDIHVSDRVLDEIVRELKVWPRLVEGYSIAFQTEMTSVENVKALLTKTSRDTVAYLDALKSPDANAETFFRLAEKRKDYVSNAVKILANLGVRSTLARFVLRMPEANLKDYAKPVDLISVLWETDADSFTPAQQRLEIIGGIVNQSWVELIILALEKALRADSVEKTYTNVFVDIQSRQKKMYKEQMEALALEVSEDVEDVDPEVEVIDVDGLNSSPQDYCNACAQSLSVVWFCQCDKAKYCGEECQARDWAVHSLFCDALK